MGHIYAVCLYLVMGLICLRLFYLELTRGPKELSPDRKVREYLIFVVCAGLLWLDEALYPGSIKLWPVAPSHITCVNWGFLGAALTSVLGFCLGNAGGKYCRKCSEKMVCPSCDVPPRAPQ
jgi:hypothetical protein